MDFDKQADIVSDCWMITRGVEPWQDLHKYLDLGFPLAYSHVNEFAELTDKGKALVEEAYSIILRTLHIEDKEYEDFEALLDENIAQNETTPED